MIISILEAIKYIAVCIGVSILTLVVTALLSSVINIKDNRIENLLVTCWCISTGLFSGLLVVYLHSKGIV